MLESERQAVYRERERTKVPFLGEFCASNVPLFWPAPCPFFRLWETLRFPLNMTCSMNPNACPMNPDGCPIHPFNTLRSLKAYYSIYMSLNKLDLPPFDHVLNTLECVVHCGHPMRRQPVISEFKVAISKSVRRTPVLLYVVF